MKRLWCRWVYLLRINWIHFHWCSRYIKRYIR